MATIRSGKHSRFPHITLNSDGQPHPVLNFLAVFTLILGLVAFALGIVIRNVASPGLGLAIPAGAIGLVAVFGGLYVQMMSATREERVLIVTGIICGFVGLAMGLAYGAFG